MIYWSGLSFSSDPVAHAGTLGNVDWEGRLLEEAVPFCEAWNVPVPKIVFSTNKHNGSKYNADSKIVTISMSEVDASSEVATDKVTPSSALWIAARVCLFHELAHCVQHRMKGDGWMEGNRLLCETHSDVFAAYWLANELTMDVVDAVAPIAFAKGGTAEKNTHPFGCVRRAANICGLGMAISIKKLRGDLSIPSSSRDELLRDSFQSATNVLSHGLRPCSNITQASEAKEQLCATCPLLDDVEPGLR